MARALGHVGRVAPATLVLDPTALSEYIELSDDDVGELRARAAASKELLSELVLSLIKWLYALILAINAGAAITVLSIDNIQMENLFWAELLFVGGIITTLLAALFIVFYSLRFFPDQELVMNIKPGIYLRSKLKEALDSGEAAEPWKDPVVYLGLVPVGFFLAGVSVVAAGITS